MSDRVAVLLFVVSCSIGVAGWVFMVIRDRRWRR